MKMDERGSAKPLKNFALLIDVLPRLPWQRGGLDLAGSGAVIGTSSLLQSFRTMVLLKGYVTIIDSPAWISGCAHMQGREPSIHRSPSPVHGEPIPHPEPNIHIHPNIGIDRAVKIDRMTEMEF
jgi:hypothetical protein